MNSQILKYLIADLIWGGGSNQPCRGGGGPEVWPSVLGNGNGSNNGSPNDRSQFLYYTYNNNKNKNACGFARDKEGHHMNLAVVPSGHTKGL